VKLLPPPGPERRRQLFWLFLLLVVVGALGYYEFGQPPAPAEARPAASNSRASGQGQAGATVLPDPVKLAALEASEDEPEAGRNLFRFGVKPPPPTPPGPPPKPAGPPPPPPPPPGPPPIALKYLGWVDRPDIGRVATLKDPATGALFQALEGQIVDGRYRVVKIGHESIVVSYVDGTGQRTIGVGG
jgi:hypothetical protein